jgi:hypothetical protein
MVVVCMLVDVRVQSVKRNQDLAKGCAKKKVDSFFAQFLAQPF